MDWVKRLKKGDMSAFDEVYSESKKAVFYAIYMVIRDEDQTQDLMQEVYISFLESVKKLSNDINVQGYLVSSAKNKAMTYYNSNKRKIEFAESCKPFSYADDKYYDTGLLKIIKDTLKEEEFKVFIMRAVGEYSFKEISEITNIPIGTLTWMFQESRQKLMKKIKE